jgi:hypothetical protein
MGTLRRLPNIDAYGYSKSFAELLAYDGLIFRDWPTNYMLNISSGHNADEATVEQVKARAALVDTFSLAIYEAIWKENKKADPELLRSNTGEYYARESLADMAWQPTKAAKKSLSLWLGN